MFGACYKNILLNGNNLHTLIHEIILVPTFAFIKMLTDLLQLYNRVRNSEEPEVIFSTV